MMFIKGKSKDDLQKKKVTSIIFVNFNYKLL